MGGLSARGWRLLIDRGGTFTDVVAVAPDGSLRVRKVPARDGGGRDAITRAIVETLGVDEPASLLESVRAGTTLATNALLERKGARVAFAVTKGFADLLLIGTQERPELFSLRIEKPAPLFERVVEIDERVMADGSVRKAPDEEAIRAGLRAAREAGCATLAVALVHAVAAPAHELLVGRIAREIGFELVVLSHEVAPEPGLLARAETAVVDAALTPVVRSAALAMRRGLGSAADVRLLTSAGGLSQAESLRGCDAILSGPAGGAVALGGIAEAAGLQAALGFDMGGTSTDVSRWTARGGVERSQGRVVGGVRLRREAVDVVTVAAGGGSILSRLGGRFLVGPESAGAEPGPAAYGRGGPATVTDANIVLGRLRPDRFPRCFGVAGDRPLDVEASRAALRPLAAGAGMTLEEAAAGFVRIANERMARAVGQVSVARGHDPREHALVPFGGAGGQHACALAARLGISSILLHPLAGVLSALGAGLACARVSARQSVLAPLSDALLASLRADVASHDAALCSRLREEGAESASVTCRLELRHEGVEGVLEVAFPAGATAAGLRAAFEQRHAQVHGYERPELPVEIAALLVEASADVEPIVLPPCEPASAPAQPADQVRAFFAQPDGAFAELEAPLFLRADLRAGHELTGPAMIAEDIGTILLDVGWRARVLPDGSLLAGRVHAPDVRGRNVHAENVHAENVHAENVHAQDVLADRVLAGNGDTPGRGDIHRFRERGNGECPPARECPGGGADPVSTELHANRFMAIAEQMGETLRRTSRSVNIRHRLDFSCALFTREGELVANAPHVPVHLGAMGETIRALVRSRGLDGMRPGLVLLSNDPYHGGSHLPDITVVTPVHGHDGRLRFFVASRAHHADVGGIVPGSMPPFATTIDEEGVRLHDVPLVEDGRLREDDVARLMAAGPHPVRGIPERLADLRAQAAANAAGARMLDELCADEGLPMVEQAMRDVIADAAEATREALRRLPRGVLRFEDRLDDGARIAVAVTVGDGRARFDFAGTSPHQPGNLNAPRAITTACVLFVLRCLVDRPIPLNAGCLEPVEILLPDGGLLDPQPPAAVAGGNVETSMRIADVLLGALGALAASQGTMNNVTFGDATFGCYETLGGGTGAGPGFPGADAVHSHLTNTRLTDVELLERRHPVLVRELSIRRDSGGAGSFRGGDGLVRALEFLAPLQVAVLSERRVVAPFGMAGGHSGACGRNRLLRADGRVEILGGKAAADVLPGDALIVETPGGGGWGPPAGA